MKKMYSEEELLEVSSTENLVDSKGRNRFIVGDGNPGSLTGLTVASSKWTLNGNNLVFEILGSFSGDLTGFNILSTFTLPEWIVNKIVTPASNVVDILTCTMVSVKDAGGTSIRVQVTKSGVDIFFTNVSTITISEPSIFKIRYNIIIDNE